MRTTQLRVTVRPLPARGGDAVDVLIEVLEDGHWFLDVTRDFYLTPGENDARAVEFALAEIRRLLAPA